MLDRPKGWTTLAEIQAFQAFEIMLLQSRRYEEWLTLFTADLRYRLPVSPVTDSGEPAGPHELAYFDDTLETLTLRVKRARSRFAWTECPPSRVRYFVAPLAFEPHHADDSVDVESNILVYQTRLQREQNVFVGMRKDRLRRVDGEFKIATRTMTLDRSVLGAKNMTVFF